MSTTNSHKICPMYLSPSTCYVSSLSTVFDVPSWIMMLKSSRRASSPVSTWITPSPLLPPISSPLIPSMLPEYMSDIKRPTFHVWELFLLMTFRPPLNIENRIHYREGDYLGLIFITRFVQLQVLWFCTTRRLDSETVHNLILCHEDDLNKSNNISAYPWYLSNNSRRCCCPDATFPWFVVPFSSPSLVRSLLQHCCNRDSWCNRDNSPTSKLCPIPLAWFVTVCCNIDSDASQNHSLLHQWCKKPSLLIYFI